MEKKGTYSPITRDLLNWYREHKRALPWRGTTDPYLIWVSEIILQQTRVAQGWDYYVRFTRRYPDIESLATASEEEVLRVWQGLGYYSRARNMHAAARDIMHRFNGKFPSDYHDILSLKGIGDYTAAAISSIAFNKPHAAVDGNVLRVIARLFTIEEPIQTTKGKKIITEIAHSLLPEEQPADFNQAIMDLGSLVCTPSNPRCMDCPLRVFCFAFEAKRTSDFPVSQKKRTTRKRYFNYFHIIHANFTYIARRTARDIWKNLYEFPLIETSVPMEIDELIKFNEFETLFGNLSSWTIDPPSSFKHVLSHQVIHARFFRIQLARETQFSLPEHFLRIEENQLDHYPVSRLIHKYLESEED